MSKEHKIVDISGKVGNDCDFPVAVIYTQQTGLTKDTYEEYLVVDPIFNDSVYNNLFGRIMTLVEATTESYKLKPVRDLFSKELNNWSSYVYSSARQLATYEDNNNIVVDNIYTNYNKLR